MKHVLAIPAMLVLIISCGNEQKGTPLSASYKEISSFLDGAKIREADLIYFHTDTPGTSLPNVHCFNASKQQLNSPPECFQLIKLYVQFMNDSVMPLKKDGIMLDSFLKKYPIVNAYDSAVQLDELQGYDYYLFIDFLAVPIESLQQTLYESTQVVRASKKKIRLFLVHVISSHNKAKVKGTKMKLVHRPGL